MSDTAEVKVPLDEYRSYVRAAHELFLREERKRQHEPNGLIHFVRYFWDILEPQTPLVEGKALLAICEHLEAVTSGKITRLLINVPPGFMKSLLTNVFWPAWEWTFKPHLRYVTFAYAASLTLRDNAKFRDLIISDRYKELWGKKFIARKIGEEKVTNSHTGWKLASSVGGVGTGERGDRIIVDDPHNVKESESDTVRNETVRWFRESLSNRVNDINHSAFVVIMQRVHEGDVSGAILKDFKNYVVLMIPMEFDITRVCKTKIGWVDWRTEDGELAWPERFNQKSIDNFKVELGQYAYAGQYQQIPEPRGGGIIKRAYWKSWTNNKYPPLAFTLAALDSAYTENHENDPSALTVWGVFADEHKNPRVILLYAWEDFVQMHELVTTVNWICTPKWKTELLKDMPQLAKMARLPVDRLLIEAKASGISAAQELKRLYGNLGNYAIELVDPKHLGGGDKVARVHAVEPVFENGMVYAPPRKFAEKVIDQMAKFPKAAHDDLTDTASMAIRWLRLMGMLERSEEIAAENISRAQIKPLASRTPLYPV